MICVGQPCAKLHSSVHTWCPGIEEARERLRAYEDSNGMESAIQTYTEAAILARLYFHVPKDAPIVSVANVDLNTPGLQEEAAMVINGHSKLHGVVDTLTDIAFVACLAYLWKREAKTAVGTLALGWACTRSWPQRADTIPDFLKDLAVYHGTNDVSSTFRFTPRVKVRVARESFELWSTTVSRFGGETGHCQIGCGVCAFCGGATAHSQFMQQYFSRPRVDPP